MLNKKNGGNASTERWKHVNRLEGGRGWYEPSVIYQKRQVDIYFHWITPRNLSALDLQQWNLSTNAAVTGSYEL